MNDAVINIKTKPEIKSKAQKVAHDLGFNLSSLLNAYLIQLIRTQTVNFSVSDEEPSEYFRAILKDAKNDVAAEDVSPHFKDANTATDWLHLPSAI